MPCNLLQHGCLHVRNPMLCRRSLRHQTTCCKSPSVSRSSRRARAEHVSASAENVPGAVCHSANSPQAFDTGRNKGRLPTQGESVVLGSGGSETMLQELPKPPADIDYLAVSTTSTSTYGPTTTVLLNALRCPGAHCGATKRS